VTGVILSSGFARAGGGVTSAASPLPASGCEHQDGGVAQDHARDGDALALAARELDAALAHMGVVVGPGNTGAK
jgi:hypothetical protein